MTNARKAARVGRRVGALSAVIVASLVGSAAAQSNVNRTQHAYPTGNAANSVILIERALPAEARAGESFNYAIRLSNATNAPVENVVLTETLATGFSMTGVEPQPSNQAGGTLTWNIGTLEPRGTRVIRVTGSAGQIGELPSCTNVSFDTTHCSGMRIVQPSLELVKSAPATVMLCDVIPLTFVVTNPGSGVAKNVQIVDDLPNGITTTNGQQQIVLPAGDLAAGQSRQFKVDVKASRTGAFENRATAREEGGLTASASTTTVVVMPQLELAKTGPASRFVNRPASYQLTVRNVGDAPAANATLTDTIPPGLRFDGASDGGQASGGQVMWRFPSIAPGESRTVTADFTPTQIGVIRNDARVAAYCAEATASYTMEVRGIPALLLEMVDVEDPDEVGTTDTYIITVTNQGSAMDTNIVITATVQPEADYVSADGPVGHTAMGKTVTFDPLPSLAPKAKAAYRVVIRGNQPGDTRFKVTMTSSQLTAAPVEETESTRFYE